MINLYSINNTEYSKNGDATLQPLRCELTMAINGGWQLELELPYDKDEKWKLVEEGTVVRVTLGCVREQATVQQRFRVYDYRKTLKSLVAIAFPVAMESTQDAPIDNLAITNKTGVEAMALLQAKTNKYTLYTDITKRGTTSISNSNLNYAIASGESGCFIDVWGGECVYDNLTYKVLAQIGDKNNASKYPVIYGRNMTGIDYERDDSGMVTRIYPISSDGIRLNGSGYVDSPIIHNYPIVHARFMSAPYQLVIDKETDNSATATATRTALAAIKTASMTPSHNITISLISGAVRVPFDYIKKHKSGDENQAGIIDSVQAMATAEIYHETLKSKANKAIKDGMMDENNGAFVVADKYLEKNWEWHEDQTVEPYAWWYGYDAQGVGDSVYARNEYIKIGKYYEYFNDDGYWEEYKRIPSIDLYHNDNGSWSIGYREGYYAHNEYVYMTVNEQMEEWWYDSDGWYVADSSGASDFGWHGDSSSGIWFGEEDAGSEDKSKYLHDCWAFIDGTYYFFDQYGYTDADPVHSLPDYPWGRQVDEKTGKEWFGNTNKSIGAKWLYNQWIKLDGDYYYVDSEGYVRDENDSVDAVVNAYVTGLASLKTVCNTQRDTLYALLYQQMTAWCNKQYEAGIDKPVVTIRVDMADLSKTDEYKNYAQLEKICLGDVVECIDSEHGINTQERVIGLTYDCIRGYNKNIVIGHTEASLGSILSTNTGGGSVPSGFDTSAIETALTTQGNAIATLQNGKQDKLTAGDNITIVNNVISATGGGAGLQYWHETATRFYREGIHEGLSADDYIYTTCNWNNYVGGLIQGYEYRKLTEDPTIMGVFGYGSNHNIAIVGLSENAVKWQWRARQSTDDWNAMADYTGTMYNVSFTYNGVTWYASIIRVLSGGSGSSGTVEGITYVDNTILPSNDDAGAIYLAKHFIDIDNATDEVSVTCEIGTQSYAFKYGGESKIFASIDIDGNAVFKEVTTDAGSLTSQMASKQDVLTAGSNVQINNNVISATDTTYTAGDNIDITNGIISSPNDVLIGASEPTSATGNNGNAYYKYNVTSETIEDQVTLPTFVDDQSTQVAITDFENYTKIKFVYTDINLNIHSDVWNISTLPQTTNPQWGQGGDIFIANGYNYIVCGRDSNGLWIKECGNHLQELYACYDVNDYEVDKEYVKIEGEWYQASSGGGGSGGKITLLASPPSGSTSFPLNTNITLAEAMTNFDCIMFCPAWSGGSAAIAYPPAIYPVAYFKALTNRAFTYYGTAGYNDVGYVNDTTVQFFRNAGETVCNAIYGIKY